MKGMVINIVNIKKELFIIYFVLSKNKCIKLQKYHKNDEVLMFKRLHIIKNFHF